MIKKTNTWYILILLMFFTVSFKTQQDIRKNKYGVRVLTDINQHNEMIQTDSSFQLIKLDTIIPEIALDLKYAGTDNFLKKKIYTDNASAFMRLPAAIALQKVQKDLKKQGLGLKVFDAYRPYSATVLMYKTYKDTLYVASPYKGSKHNRACAIDLTLIDLKTKQELKMPTPYDAFTGKASPSYMNLPEEVLINRTTLIQAMSKHGFHVNPGEWWHFDFKSWRKYPLMDLSFEEIKKQVINK